jgi:hypothetical protein
MDFIHPPLTPLHKEVLSALFECAVCPLTQEEEDSLVCYVRNELRILFHFWFSFHVSNLIEICNFVF